MTFSNCNDVGTAKSDIAVWCR